jgi:hypothetical protein
MSSRGKIHHLQIFFSHAESALLRAFSFIFDNGDEGGRTPDLHHFGGKSIRGCIMLASGFNMSHL